MGVSVTVDVPASYAVEDDTTWLVAALRSTIETDAGVTDSLKVAEGRVVAGAPVEPGAGLRAVTVGAVLSTADSANTTSTQ